MRVVGDGQKRGWRYGSNSSNGMPGHRDHTGGGKPPPPIVTPVRHAGALEGAERLTYYHRSVRHVGGEWKRRRLAEEYIWESAERNFQAYVRPLANVASIKYLGQVLKSAGDDWTEVVGNLWKA